MNVTIQNGFLRVTARTEGAELMSILSSDGTEYLWQGDPKYWADRSLTLFPYVARLFGGTYELDGNTCRMPIHGFAPHAEFIPEQRSREEMTFVLTETEETRKCYPRSFRFSVTYRLEGSTLFVTYEVGNTDSRDLYFGLGGHPGFNVPLEEGKSFEDYRLRFSSAAEPKRIGFTADCFRDGTESPFPLEEKRILPLSHSLFDDDAVVLKDAAKEVTLETGDGGRSVTVRYPDMPYLSVWHAPKTDAPYVCIEPWLSLPSQKGEKTVFEKRPDLVCLPPDGRYGNTWSMTFKAE